MVFWDNEWPSDTDGDLTGTVLFAQAQIMPSKHRVAGDDTQPHLTAQRKTLVMFQPSDGLVSDADPLVMRVLDGDGRLLGSAPMEHPNNIPKQAGWVPNLDPSLAFPHSLNDPHVVQGQANLNPLNDPGAARLTEILTTVNTEVEIKLWDGSWTSDVYLPEGDAVPADSVVRVSSNAGYKVSVNYRDALTGGWRLHKLSRNTQTTLVLSDGVWVSDMDLDHNEYVFGRGFWTATMDAAWVKPGIAIEFHQESDQGLKLGRLDDVEVGGRLTELVVAALDAGFLTEPRDEFTFKDDPTTHRDSFETIPASRLVVVLRPVRVRYESLHLTEVMLPQGVLYTSSSADTGGVYSGDMRQLGKILLSHGIDLANYGIWSSSGTSESPHPFSCALIAAHNTVGQYANGRVVHGLSGARHTTEPIPWPPPASRKASLSLRT